MQNSVALFDDLLEGPRFCRDEGSVLMLRSKRRKKRVPATFKPTGMHRRKNKRWAQ